MIIAKACREKAEENGNAYIHLTKTPSEVRGGTGTPTSQPQLNDLTQTRWSTSLHKGTQFSKGTVQIWRSSALNMLRQKHGSACQCAQRMQPVGSCVLSRLSAMLNKLLPSAERMLTRQRALS